MKSIIQVLTTTIFGYGFFIVTTNFITAAVNPQSGWWAIFITIPALFFFCHFIGAILDKIYKTNKSNPSVKRKE